MTGTIKIFVVDEYGILIDSEVVSVSENRVLKVLDDKGNELTTLELGTLTRTTSN
jgi:hypothetical protein